MKRGTIKILLPFLCLAFTLILDAQVVDVPVIPQVTVTGSDSLSVTTRAPRQIKASPVPGIKGPQDIRLDRDESLKFLERFSSSPAIWKRSNDPLREAIAEKDAIAVIPNNPSRAKKHPFDRHLYAQRHLIECCFSRLKQFRRVATRYEKTARNYLAVVTLAATILWLR